MDDAREPVRNGLLKLILKLLVALGIVGWLVWKVNSSDEGDSMGKLLSALSRANYLWLIPAAFLYAFHIFANAWRWHILLRVQKIDCSLWTAFSLTMQSFFFSLVMPGGALGGDVVRAAFIAGRIEKGRRFDGVFTILMDRFTGMLGLFSLAIVILPFSWWCISSGEGIGRTFIFVLLAGSAVGLAAGFVVFKHRFFERFRLYGFFQRLTDRFTHGLFTQVAEALDSYASAGKEIFLCVATGVVCVNFVLALVMWCVTLSLSGAVFTAALGAITVGNIAGLLPMTPSGLGVRDYFVMTILAASGMNSEDALGSALLMSFLIIAFNLAGGVFFLFDRGKRSKMKVQAEK